MHSTAHRPRFTRRILTASIGALLLASPVRAADVTWTNGAGNSLWNTSSLNWSTGAWNNATLDGAIFGPVGVGNVTVAAPITLRSLNFTSGGYTLTGSNALTFSRAGSSTLGARTISVETGAARIDAPVVSTAGLEIRGAGTLTLSNSANSFSGFVPVGNTGLAVNLQIGSATSTTGGGNLTLASAAALPVSTVVGIGSGVLDIGATNPTIAGLIFANTNASGGTTGRVAGTGTLTVAGEIQVVGNGAGFGNQIAANLNIPSGTQIVRVGDGSGTDLVFNNVISGAGGLFVTHGGDTTGVPRSYGTVALLGDNTYTGATTFSGGFNHLAAGANASSSLTVAGGSVTLQGAGGAFASASTVRIAPLSLLTLDNVAALTAGTNRPAVAAGNRSNRLSTGAALAMEGGDFTIVGAANVASSQQVASLTIGEGFNTLTLIPGSGGSSIFSATGNLAIAPGATVLFRAPTLPLTTAAAQASTAFTFAATPAPVGGILVGAVGDTGSTGSAGFVRHVSAGNVGIALLAPGEYTPNSFTTAGANVDVTANQTVGAPITVNAIRTGGFTTALNSPVDDVTVSSGMILATDNATFSGNGALNFGSQRGYFVGGGNVAVSAPITGTAGLTKGSLSFLTLSGDNAGLSGGIVVHGGTLVFATNTAATAFAGSLSILAGAGRFSVADAGSGDVNLGSAATPAGAAAASPSLDLSSSAVATFARRINVLGNGGSDFGGPGLFVPNTATTQTLTGAISLGNNLRISGGTAGSVLNVDGAITGGSGIFLAYDGGTLNITSAASSYGGDLFLTGNGTVNLASASRNLGAGGITQTAGTLVVSVAANLGSGAVKLRGGTFQTNFSGTLSRNFSIGADHTLAIGNNSPNFTGSFNGAQGTVTKTGLGALSITGVGDFAGNFALGTGAGSLFIRSGGRLPNLGTVTLGQGTLFRVDNSSTNLSNRVGAATNIAFNSAGVTGGATAQITTNDAATDSFTLGTLSLTGGTAGNPHTSTLLISDSNVGDHTITFQSLTPIPANNTLAVSGTANLGKTTAGGSRVFFTTPPTPGPNGSIPGLTFTGFGGSGSLAEYDPALGVIAYLTTSGTFIDNIANVGPGSPTPTDANFTTTGATTANLGATIKSLTLAGHDVTLVSGVRAPQAGNLNAPADTLVLTSGRLLATTDDHDITAGSAAKVQFGSTGTARALIDVSSGAQLSLQTNVTPVTTGGLTKTGAGDLFIFGGNQITGDYDIQAGFLQITAGSSTAASLTGAGGTALVLNGPLTVTGGIATTFAGRLGGVAGSSLNLSAAHTGTLTLTGPNNITGAFQVNGGTLVAGSALALGNAANPVTVTSGGTLGFTAGISENNANPVSITGVGASGRAGALDNLSSGINSFFGPITLAGPATIGATDGTLALAGVITGNGHALTVNPTGTSTLALSAGPNLGAATLTKSGTGPLKLNASGGTFASLTVTGGLVRGSSADVFGQTTGGSPSPITLNGGGIQYGGAFLFETTRVFTLGTNGGSLDTNGFDTGFVSVMSGPGSFTKLGAGNLTLNAVQTYGGSTNVARGFLTFGGANFLPATTVVALGTANSATSASVDLAGFSQTIGGLSLAAGNTGGTDNVLANSSGTAATLTIDAATDSTFGGSLGESTNLSLIKQGPGTQTLTAANTYTGTTAVNAGTLALGNGGNLNGLGAVSVANGATLAIRPGVSGATNDINGAITLGATSTFTMADGAASSVSTNGVIFAGGASTVVFDVGGTTTTAADFIFAVGPSSIAAPGGKITINGFGTVANAAGTYTLIDAGSGSALDVNPFSLANTRVGVGGRAYPLSLASTPTLVRLTVGAAQGADQAFWKGDVSGVWNANTAGNTNWATTASGATDLAALPSPLTDVIFSATGAGNLTTTLGASTAVNSVTFTSGSGAVTIGAGGSLTPSAAGVGNLGFQVAGGTALRTVNVNVAIESAQTWLNDGAFGVNTLAFGGASAGSGVLRELTIAGRGNTVISGSLPLVSVSSLVKTGAGTLTLGQNTGLAGGTTVNGGVVSISADANLGDAANDVTLNPGGTLRLGAIITLGSGRSLVVNGTPTNPSGLDLSAGATGTLAHTTALTGAGTVQVSVTGGASASTLSIEEAQAFTGNLEVGKPGKLVGATLSQRIFSAVSGLILRLQNSGKLASVSSVKVNNGSGLQVSQGSTAVLNRIAAALTFNNGRFQYDPNGSTVINDTFGTVTATGLLTLTGGATAGPAAGTTLNFGTFTRTGSATLALQSESTFGQGSIGGGANAGVNYKFSGMSDVGGSGTARNVVPWAAATLGTGNTDLRGLVTYDANGFRPLAANEYVNATVQGLWDDTIAGGPKNIDLRTDVTVTGPDTIAALANTQGVDRNVTGTGTLVNNSGAFVSRGAFIFNGPTVNLPAGGYFHLGQSVQVQGASTITGTGGVTTSALDATTNTQLRLTNTAANTFTGGLFINGNSQVTFTANNQLGQAGGLNAGAITLGGGQLLFNPASATTVSLSDGGTTRAITVNGSNGTIGTAVSGAVLQISGVISGEGQVQFGGGALASAGGVVELTNANTYTGGTLISQGILRLSNANQLGTGPVLLNGGTLQAAANLTFATAPTVTATSGIDTGANTVTLSAGLGGSAGTTGTAATTLVLAKFGSGTLEIAGDSTFAGTLSVATGRVLLRGALSGVSALSTATSTARLELGVSDGINDSAAVTLTGSTLATAGFSETLGTLMLATGVSTLDLGTGASLFRFAASNLQPWTGTLSITNWSGTLTGGGTDQLFFGTDATGLAAGQLAAITFLDPAGFAPGTYAAALLATGELVAAPEPGSSTLLLAGLSLLGARRRRSASATAPKAT